MPHEMAWPGLKAHFKTASRFGARRARVLRNIDLPDIQREVSDITLPDDCSQRTFTARRSENGNVSRNALLKRVKSKASAHILPQKHDTCRLLDLSPTCGGDGSLAPASWTKRCLVSKPQRARPPDKKDDGRGKRGADLSHKAANVVAPPSPPPTRSSLLFLASVGFWKLLQSSAIFASESPGILFEGSPHRRTLSYSSSLSCACRSQRSNHGS